jgi:hypothetical protein
MKETIMNVLGLFKPPDVSHLKSKQDVTGLTKALTYKKDPVVRKAAAEALAIIRDGRAVESLIAALQDSDGAVRRAVVWALEKIGDGRAVEPLIAALQDGDEAVRQAAVSALGTIGDKRAVEPLRAALQDSDGSVRQAAARELRKMGIRWEGDNRITLNFRSQDVKLRDALLNLVTQEANSEVGSSKGTVASIDSSSDSITVILERESRLGLFAIAFEEKWRKHSVPYAVNRDFGLDVDSLVYELVNIARANGFFRSKSRVCEIGEHLNSAGGIGLMRAVHRRVVLFIGDGSHSKEGSPRSLDMVWGGIGEWMG